MWVETLSLDSAEPSVILTAYLTAERGELHQIAPRPAVVVCPGGAYLGLSDREAEPVALRFAAMGYQTFVLRYSVYGEEMFPKKQVTPKARCRFPEPMRDIARAMENIHNHAGDWGVDTRRIVLCGFSAGAHNVAMYSVYWNTPLIQEAVRVEAEALRPAAAILGYTMSDYTFLQNSPKEPLAQGLFQASMVAYLGQENPDPRALEAASPCRLVNADTPPMFLWATCEDKLVPVQHSLRMAHALADQGIAFELHIYESGDHGLSLANQASAIAKSQTDPDAAGWVALAEAWLQKRFALELPRWTQFQQPARRDS